MPERHRILVRCRFRCAAQIGRMTPQTLKDAHFVKHFLKERSKSLKAATSSGDGTHWTSLLASMFEVNDDSKLYTYKLYHPKQLVVSVQLG